MMRILLVNKYYYLRSGTERYLFNLKRLLEARGHVVEAFAMQHLRNEPATYAADFAPGVDYRALSGAARLAAAARVIWNPEAGRRIGRALDAFRPDVVHVLNIYHQISPAVLPPITRRSIPIVQTLNDYKLICPNYLLYTDDGPCTRCRGGQYAHALGHRCMQGSRAWSALAALEMTLHKAARVYERHVAAFIAPSRFVQRTAESFGVPAGQLVHIPYFLFPGDFTPTGGEGSYAAYVGRLSREKGLGTLVAAMRHASEVPLVLVGEGPLRPELEALATRWGLSNVRFSGYQSGPALTRALSEARFSVLPSEWHEVFGQTITESFAVARPVVATRMGGIPELIDEGLDGSLVEPRAAEALAERLRALWLAPARAAEMGQAGRRKVAARYDDEAHYARLMALYREVGAG
ncbi:MAG: glycosyltransferase family 4 protein [Anaerolineales bacterium]|nr:glycosyltransferase family 4 protein [Anaerolineales bacterium]